MKGSTTAKAFVNGVARAAIKNIENVVGGSSNHTIKGDRLANALVGGAGIDALAGNKGKDTLDGGIGADTLSGGKGKDLLTGGADADTFVFDVAATRNNTDTILDFASSEDPSGSIGKGFKALDKSQLDDSDLGIGAGKTAKDKHDVYYNEETARFSTTLTARRRAATYSLPGLQRASTSAQPTSL